MRHPSHLSTTPLAVFLVSSLKSATYLRHGEQLHALVVKSGLLLANRFVRNSLLFFYTKLPSLSGAYHLFDEIPRALRDATTHNTLLAALSRAGLFSGAHQMLIRMPERDTVSYTTLVTALARAGRSEDALAVFRGMLGEPVPPNEVTLASVLSALARATAAAPVAMRMVHAIAVRRGLEAPVLVATNLVHAYAVALQLDAARAVFDGMADRNTITWNAMLNGYIKAGMIDTAVELFWRIPERDVVSWLTMIDGYLDMDRMEKALVMYISMLRELDARINEALLVDMVKACARHSAIMEGQQLHAVIVKNGLDAHDFVQVTLINFYGACKLLDLAQLQFELADKSHLTSWNAIMAALLRSNLVDEARQLFDKMPERDVISWSALIAGYVQNGRPEMALQLFSWIQSTGVEPNGITLASVLSAVANSGRLEQGRWIHEYIISKSIPLGDNLSAGLINMYAKCSSISDAMQVFDCVKDVSPSVSPWNAIICSLAIHGHAHTSLNLFSQLQRTNIRPNSITFIGVLNACCHAGLVAEGRHHFEFMKREYGIEPTIKHYGCMVDLLGRAGCLEEAEKLIGTMPMKADVMIWGSMLAAARTHGNLVIGERAAESLARLEPSHGASRVLLSNIYADVGRWKDVSEVREELVSGGLETLPGSSGILQ